MGTEQRQKATFLSSISKCVYIRAGNPLTPLDCDAIVWYLRENQVYIRQTKEATGDIFFLVTSHNVYSSNLLLFTIKSVFHSH